MRALSPEELLDLTVQGRHRGPAERALLLLARAWPEATPEDRARLSLGRRDALVMALRAHTFGTATPLRALCPECGEDLEADLDLSQILAAHPPGEPPEELCLEADAAPPPESADNAGRTITFRLPSTDDLLALGSGAESHAGPHALLRRILISSADAGDAEGAGDALRELSEEDLAALSGAVSDAIAEADPLAEVRLDLTCEACGAAAPQAFDIVSFFWAEIEAAARRIVEEVHLLAWSYGWSESQILALDPERRRLYLELVQGQTAGGGLP